MVVEEQGIFAGEGKGNRIRCGCPTLPRTGWTGPKADGRRKGSAPTMEALERARQRRAEAIEAQTARLEAEAARTLRNAERVWWENGDTATCHARGACRACADDAR